MSSYTMPLKAYIEQATQFDDNLSTRERIEQGRTQLFDFDYPFFDDNLKADFETHFIREFYMREIGFETGGLFKFRLETWLIINMPYFNKLFESEGINYDPLANSEMDVTHTKTTDTTKDTSGNTDTTASGSSQYDSFNRDVHSDNPDSRLKLTANDGEGVIEYASTIDENTSNGNESGDSQSNENRDQHSDENETEDFGQHRQGKIGVQTYAKMIQEHREAFLRIERQIFSELQELFMLVY